jgi:Icc-related predicted phosphoesterase
MTLLVIADDEAVLQNSAGDRGHVLVSCGDLADPVILESAKRAQCSKVFAVKGNHDSSAPFSPPIVDLHLTTHTVDGLRFGGFNGVWRYKPRGHYLYEQEEVERLLASFAPVDVFVAHNSPRHIHDRDDEVHIGFEAFVRYIKRGQPRLFLHGHQHIKQETAVGGTRVIGVYGQRRLEI